MEWCDASILGPAPEAAPVEEQGFDWSNPTRTAKGRDTVTSGQKVLDKLIRQNGTTVIFEMLFDHESEVTKESCRGSISMGTKKYQGTR